MKKFVVIFITISFFSSYFAAVNSHIHENKFDGFRTDKLILPKNIVGEPSRIGAFLDELLKAISTELRYFLSVIFKNLFKILNNVVPRGTTLNVKRIIVLLKSEKNPSVLTVLTGILKLCKADKCLALELVPGFILNTRINTKAFIKLFRRQCNSRESVTFPFLINVIGDYLVNVYSIRLH